ncbi:MAG: histidinol-phosphate transaminase [Lachnospiraceae bacterium]|nr:histidinol-phosphate transaminase [Lachnospiraceae bacterium]
MGFEENLRRVTPYVPGEQPKAAGIIKLNTNECPYPPSPKVREVLKGFDADSLRLYPDPEGTALKEALSAAYGLAKEQVFLGVGSDEVLALAFQTFFAGRKPVLFPAITYSFYPVWAELYRIPYKQLPLKDGFQIDAGDFQADNGGIVIPNPNAPTGVLLPLSEVESILKANQDSVVIIDEAYIDFAWDFASGKPGENPFSAVSLIDKYENLLVVQTFSKSRSLAGLRVGMAFGNAKLIKYLSDVKYSFNSYTMNRLSIACGAAAVQDSVYFSEIVSKIINTREAFKQELRARGWSFPDSKTNFLFARPPKGNAKELFEALKRKNIYVRYFPAAETAEYLRITIGTEEQMQALFKELN